MLLIFTTTHTASHCGTCASAVTCRCICCCRWSWWPSRAAWSTDRIRSNSWGHLPSPGPLWVRLLTLKSWNDVFAMFYHVLPRSSEQVKEWLKQTFLKYVATHLSLENVRRQASFHCRRGGICRRIGGCDWLTASIQNYIVMIDHIEINHISYI